MKKLRKELEPESRHEIRFDHLPSTRVPGSTICGIRGDSLLPHHKITTRPESGSECLTCHTLKRMGWS